MKTMNTMKTMKILIQKIISPFVLDSWTSNILIAIPRVIGGLLLCFEFGSSKFGMPWSVTKEMGFLQVASWFPKDIAEFGLPFSLAPYFFAWLAAASEAIGGLLFAFGIGTRLMAFLIANTMLVAVFFQKWSNALEYGSSWPLLPALGFLWIAIYTMVFGSGKIGLDYLISKSFSAKKV